jgi:hypothetical protein
MDIFSRLKGWHADRTARFVDEPTAASIEARLGAAEYECQLIARDVAAVVMDRSPRKIAAPQKVL